MPSASARISFGIVLMVFGCKPVWASEPAATHPCARIIGADERLACYDRAFPPVHDAHAEAAEQARTFGFPQKPLSARQAKAASHDKQIDVQVASVGSDADGERLFTLNNGQVWRQTESSVLGLVRPGDVVTIRAASFGSYFLTTAGGVPLRVRRVR